MEFVAHRGRCHWHGTTARGGMYGRLLANLLLLFGQEALLETSAGILPWRAGCWLSRRMKIDWVSARRNPVETGVSTRTRLKRAFSMDRSNELLFESATERTREEKDATPQGIAVIINEVQLILAEKRTSLATLRTGIAVFALPLSVLSVLIATSKYYDIYHVLSLLLPLLVLCAALVLLGTYLIVRAIIRIHRYDVLIQHMKEKHSQIAEFID